jgi:hypothetical protein
MPNRKLKSENYSNLGGINSKASPYTLGPQEFLDLQNFDFQTPGSLSSRWGSTFGVGQTFAAPVHTIYEFAKTDGSSQIIVGHSGGMWTGSTTGQLTGMSFAAMSATIGITGGLFSWTYIAGGAYISSTPTEARWGSGSTAFRADPLTYWIHPQAIGTRPTDFSTIGNLAYGANGSQFFKFDGTNTGRVGLPIPVQLGSTLVGSSVGGLHFKQDDYITVFYGAFLSVSGQEGPRFPITSIDHRSLDGSTLVGAYGSTLISVRSNIATPLGFGITALNLYSYSATTTSLTVATAGTSNVPLYFFGSVAVSGSTITTITYGSTGLGTSNTAYADMIYNAFPRAGNALDYQSAERSFGLTLVRLSAAPITQFVQTTEALPSITETYANAMFIAGFTAQPSTFKYTEPGVTEDFPAENVAEVRTNDGDKITALKAFGPRLMIFKYRSTHQLTGDSSDNYNLSEVSSDYGCVNNRCAVTYTDLCAFLDPKGLIIYNGAGLNLASFKIQPLIDRINQSAAATHAIVAHDKLRNQLLVGVPLDGATLNNTTLVYDYVVNAWTKYTGFNPSAFATIKSNAPDETVWFGDYSGRVAFQGASFTSDFGTGFTCSMQTRFLSELGQSVEKQWRRLYINVDETVGATVPLAIDFFRNYGATVALSRTMYSTPFQSRIDYGLSAKSLSFRLSESSATTQIKVHGYTIEYRYQRGV